MDEDARVMRLHLYICLGMFVVFGGLTLLLWIGWIQDAYISDPKNQKLQIWGLLAAGGLSMAIYSFLELRAHVAGTAAARQHLRVGRILIGTPWFLVGAAAASVGTVFVLQLASKPWTDWFEDNFVAAAVIMTAVVALAGVGTFRVLRRRDPSSTFLVAALIILAPFGSVAAVVFFLIMLLLVVIAIMSAALDPSMAMMVERNFGLAMGVAVITMAAVVASIYVVRREPNTDWRTILATLGNATWTVVIGTWIITFGGAALMITLAVLKVNGVLR